eukprot:1012399-Pyramimonas_sp.AAC.1
MPVRQLDRQGPKLGENIRPPVPDDPEEGGRGRTSRSGERAHPHHPGGTVPRRSWEAHAGDG